MSNERILEDIAIHDEWLRLGIKDAGSEEYNVQESVEHISFFLASSVVILEWSTVRDLRQRVRWANDLDREAVEKLAIPTVTSMADHSEALARRIVHHSSRNALDQIKSRRLRQNLRVRSALRQCGSDILSAVTLVPGMGHQELKDCPSRDDFADQR